MTLTRSIRRRVCPVQTQARRGQTSIAKTNFQFQITKHLKTTISLPCQGESDTKSGWGALYSDVQIKKLKIPQYISVAGFFNLDKKPSV